MSEVNFFSEDIDFLFKDEDKAASWLNLLSHKHLKELGEINFIFCSDDYLHQLNVEYLQHDTLTDIITFPHEEEDSISGDVFISIERVKDNAIEYGVDEMTELIRVMAHGLLHLCGYKDKTVEDQKTMRLQEDLAIKLWNEES
jgi:rRNA maturation RNase YbeY